MLHTRSLPEYEEQATACLKAAEQHRETLLKFARGISGGDDEAGRELYQEAVLRAHDTIQGVGFHGEGYQFYIWRIIRNLHQEEKTRIMKLRPFTTHSYEEEADNQTNDYKRIMRPLQRAVQEHTQPLDYDSRVQLADQINYELTERCTPADQAMFQLHVNGQSYREIEQLTGRNYRTVGHRIQQIKTMLAGIFRPAYEGLE